MRLKTVLTFGATLGAALYLLPPAVAAGGEDWPHFCHLTDESAGGVDSFRIRFDASMPDNYGIELMLGDQTVDYIDAQIYDTDDQGNVLPYYQVTATGDVGILRHRQVLLFVQKDSTKESSGDVEVSFTGNRTFDLKPMSCGSE